MRMSERRIYQDKSFAIHVTFAGEDQLHLVASVEDKHADPASTCAAIYRRVVEILGQSGMQVVHERIFGSIHVHPTVIAARRDVMRERDPGRSEPITFIEGHPLWGSGFAGIQIQAIRPSSPDSGVWTIHDDDVPCGRGWKRKGATFLALQNILGPRKNRAGAKSRQMQAERMFERADRILRTQGATYRNVVRTWIYLSNILAWYGEFNAVRNAQYRQFGLLPDLSENTAAEPHRLPASTGIGGDNLLGAACVMDLLAVVGHAAHQPQVALLTNVKQDDAFHYGSAFSRGSCVQEPDVTHIQISGTAAVDERGKSLFVGDLRDQILRTIENVESLLAPQGATLEDICSATVFVKRAEDVPVFRQVAAERGLADLPAVCVLADICREELLFEIDGVAAVGKPEK